MPKSAKSSIVVVSISERFGELIASYEEFRDLRGWRIEDYDGFICRLLGSEITKGQSDHMIVALAGSVIDMVSMCNLQGNDVVRILIESADWVSRKSGYVPDLDPVKRRPTPEACSPREARIFLGNLYYEISKEEPKT